MRSMTGYGRGNAVAAGVGSVTVEVKAVNHRFLDLKVREVGTAESRVGVAVEERLTARVRERVDRGSLTVSLQVVRPRAAAATFAVDLDAAVHTHAVLAAAASRLGLPGPDLALVLAQPGVTVAQPAAAHADDAVTAVVLAALDTALDDFERMRSTEGHALAAELAQQLDQLDALRERLAAAAHALPAQLAQRLEKRIAALLDGSTKVAVDPARLAQEVALLVDRTDVTEELVRLASHLSQTRALVAQAIPVGRRLDFLAQEIGRELNTIGSKSALSELTALVVDAKAVLEKIREQIQNVE